MGLKRLPHKNFNNEKDITHKFSFDVLCTFCTSGPGYH